MILKLVMTYLRLSVIVAAQFLCDPFQSKPVDMPASWQPAQSLSVASQPVGATNWNSGMGQNDCALPNNWKSLLNISWGVIARLHPWLFGPGRRTSLNYSIGNRDGLCAQVPVKTRMWAAKWLLAPLTHCVFWR